MCMLLACRQLISTTPTRTIIGASIGVGFGQQDVGAAGSNHSCSG